MNPSKASLVAAARGSSVVAGQAALAVPTRPTRAAAAATKSFIISFFLSFVDENSTESNQRRKQASKGTKQINREPFCVVVFVCGREQVNSSAFVNQNEKGSLPLNSNTVSTINTRTNTRSPPTPRQEQEQSQEDIGSFVADAVVDFVPHKIKTIRPVPSHHSEGDPPNSGGLWELFCMRVMVLHLDFCPKRVLPFKLPIRYTAAS